MLFQLRHPIDEPGAYSSWVGIQAIKKIQLLTDTDGHGVLTFSRGHGKTCESPWFLWDLFISKAVEALVAEPRRPQRPGCDSKARRSGCAASLGPAKAQLWRISCTSICLGPLGKLKKHVSSSDRFQLKPTGKTTKMSKWKCRFLRVATSISPSLGAYAQLPWWLGLVLV